ncbi:aldose 1-epimerase [Pseudomonas cuatrocienegasensis]|uniref:Aldose 1-epimerase n=1 Tax=Pseudomonas cuatrocienegasensis TaxID=543360 RepID=A0ABY1BBM3_9PSED|nr:MULTISPECIES: aldose 1-epimerase [Pseudomonas]OEC32700.1 aldose epimerase [Pseudomonas sp. 21C1]SEQ46074.1 aldose 1-epimerase [Pseudomonas cuatrocienegasensis]
MPATLIQLHDRLTTLTLAPACGGSLVNWTTRDSGHALLRHSDAEALAANTARRLACYPLLPWSNRIGAGGYQTPDGWFALKPNSPGDALPIHGSAWQQPWQVSEQQADSVCLTLDSQVPFAYHAEQRIQLHEGRLHIALRVRHLDARANWHGLGLHLYITRTAHTQLQVSAQQVWLSDEQQLSREQQPVPAAWDFHQAAPLPDSLVDHAFTGWDGSASILQPDLGYRIDCQAEGSDCYLLFCPVERPFFCLEPVSHPVNAHHLPGQPGLRLLQQGEEAHLTLTLHYRPGLDNQHAANVQ